MFRSDRCLLLIHINKSDYAVNVIIIHLCLIVFPKIKNIFYEKTVSSVSMLYSMAWHEKLPLFQTYIFLISYIRPVSKACATLLSRNLGLPDGVIGA